MGDRVLGLLMAEWLAERFPDEPEGLLARRHADLVAEPQLAAIGAGLGLSDMLVVAPNEARAGVGRGVAVVADAMEAVLGAIYLDGGLEAARHLVRQAWRDAVDAQAEPPKHPKSDLKEWLEARGTAAAAIRRGVAHRPGPLPSRSPCRCRRWAAPARGTASTKQMAERDAAADLLRQLQA